MKYPIFFLLSIFTFISCAQKEDPEVFDPLPGETMEKVTEGDPPHEYGGWYCPDNFGFVPVDIQELEKVPIVQDRLPTREEASSGHSLIFVDTAKYKDARPLDIQLPAVARRNSHGNGIAELIIVIQAVVIGEDTIVGYRFPSGGNGSARLKEVTFLSDQDVRDIGPAPFFYEKITVKATKEDIWNAMITTQHARDLGERFDQLLFFNSEWNELSEAHLEYDEGKSSASGYVGNHFGNIYLHIDYDNDGHHFSEKILIGNSEDGSAEFHMAMGPYPTGLAKEASKWKDWMQEVKGIVDSR